MSRSGQKAGKAFTINDNTQVDYPRPVMYEMKSAMADATGGGAPRETLAIGEINITANVAVSFILE